MGIPTTLVQLLLIMLTLVPGVTFQFTRERARGRRPGERDFQERVLRALIASIVLDLVYVAVAGPWFARTLGGSGGLDEALRQDGHLLGLAALACLFLVPAGAALALSWWQSRKHPTFFTGGGPPSAWDAAFSTRRECFVRARLKDTKTWVGGFYGPDSFSTSYPEPQEIYLESSWSLGKDGRFLSRVPHTGGIIIRGSETDIIEFVRKK